MVSYRLFYKAMNFSAEAAVMKGESLSAEGAVVKGEILSAENAEDAELLLRFTPGLPRVVAVVCNCFD